MSILGPPPPPNPQPIKEELWQPRWRLGSPHRLETSLGPRGGVLRLREQPVRSGSCACTGPRDAKTLLGHGEGQGRGLIRQLLLKVLFWVRRVTHPFQSSDPRCSALRPAAGAQPDSPGEPTARYPLASTQPDRHP